MRVIVIPVVVGALGIIPQSLWNRLEGNLWKNRYHLDYSNVKIGKNTQKNPGDFKRFVVTQKHQLTPVRKTHSE